MATARCRDATLALVDYGMIMGEGADLVGAAVAYLLEIGRH
ncbi:MAG TPA: hypothetical protein VNS79_10235 [Sphingobium sp.]|nr:hypothetical protein [Sphingobium sp.]